jgi:pimeloyl-ACP methyl ester carboxylesterase
MDALGWQRAHVAGNSLGGLIALRLGMRGRARSVTAISPAGKARGWERTWARGVLRVVHAAGPLAGRLGPVKDTAIGRQLAMGIIFGQPARMSPGYAHLSLEALELATAFHETMDAIDLEVADVKPTGVPTTIAWGDRDVLLWPWQGQRWHADLPGSRLVRLAGLGHTPMPDDPDVLVDVITRTAAAAA